MIGSRRAHYTIESRIGAGGMGEVYRALDTKLGRSVAIKLLPSGSSEHAESIHRFIREAKAASSLNHPNIVTIHEIGEDESGPFIVMEHITGSPLNREIGEPMPLDRFFDRALQITSALGAAHAAGVVHRDVKPANIMVTDSGLVKVVDFGLARLTPLGAGDQDALTARVTSPPTTPGSIIGTVGYMSPEQIEGTQASPRSDVFSTGIVLYEMLTGRPVFRASSTIATLTAILRDEPPKLSSLRQNIPPALAALVARCMAKDPTVRYADCGEVHRELLRIKEFLDDTGRRSWLRRPVGKAVIALAVVVLAAAAVLWWRRMSAERWARNEALPQIERLSAASDLDGAYRLALRAMAIIPDDPQLKQLWTNLTFPMKVESDPPGADVAFKVYAAPDSSWIPLGKTPTETVGVPVALLRFRLTRDGYVPLEVAPEVDSDVMRFKLQRVGDLPPRMVVVPRGPTTFQGNRVDVPAFRIDQYEVTNREYKRFVDGGGYEKPELWKHPIVKGGRTLPWKEAMAEMVDGTGRPGPSTWELGTYPEGQGDHPVDGVSWYEAAAYAELAGKKLPTVYHWSRAATDFSIFSDLLTSSHFAGKSTVAVGTMPSLGPHGTFDMAGNVKEWCSNANGERRYSLGGAFFEASYQYLEGDARPVGTPSRIRVPAHAGRRGVARPAHGRRGAFSAEDSGAGRRRHICALCAILRL